MNRIAFSRFAARPLARTYHSVGQSSASPAQLVQDALGLQPKAASVLLKTLDTQVPAHGFSEAAITTELRSQGLSDAARQVFPHGRGGVLDLVLTHLVRERARLFEFAEETSLVRSEKTLLDNVSALVRRRIQGNEPIGEHLSDVLSKLALPTNMGASLKELHALSDDIWFLAGDESHDFSWYNRRLVLSSLYVSTEMFMSQDRSSGYRDTYEFLERRLAEANTAKYVYESVGEWSWFNALAVYNIQKAFFSRG